MTFQPVRTLALGALLAALPAHASAQPDSDLLASSVDSIIEAALDDDQSVSYAVGVKRGRDIVVSKGYGTADLENDIAATARTIYRLGSITKQFTAAAIMQLVEENKIALDDEVTKFLPDYPTQGHRVTIHHLLTHTSGIRSYTGMGEAFWNQAARDLTHDEMLAIFQDEPFDFAPGEEYRYNNSGFYLLGMIVEQASGDKYDEYLAQRIFGPLELSRTSYCHEDDIIPGRAQGYRKQDGAFRNDAPISMNTPGAAGALCSTVADLMWWQDAFNAGRVVSAESRRRMITPARLNDGSATSYGYGLGIGELDGHPMIAHGGGINGFNTQLSYFPDDDLTVVVLANTEGSNPGRIARDISRVALGIEVEPPLDLPLDAAALTLYSGEYEVAGFTVRVYADGGQLRLDGPGMSGARLLSQGDHVFLLEPDPAMRVTFAVSGGVSESFTLGQGAEGMTATRKR